MSKLDDLINELCPDGVEYKTIGEVCEILDNKRKPVTKAARTEGEYPYYGANGIQDYVSEYIFDGTFVLVGEDGSVITKTGNPVVTWATGKIWVNNHAHIISEKNGVMLRYLFHILQTLDITALVHGNIPKLTGGDFKALQIPVPPLEVQNEIVRILDKFTSLEAELEAELEARRKQYEWAKQKLLTIKKENIFELQELCNIEKGKTPIQKAIPGEYPLVVTTDKRSSCIDYQFDCKAVCLSLVSARGHGIAQISRIFYQDGKFALGNILCAMIPKDENILNAKYLRYYLFYMKDIILTPLMKGGANVALHISDLQTVKIPVPPIEQQNEIVSILDRFESLCNDITSGLPAEIEARHKQYEYYRDKLLTFKRKEA